MTKMIKTISASFLIAALMLVGMTSANAGSASSASSAISISASSPNSQNVLSDSKDLLVNITNIQASEEDLNVDSIILYIGGLNNAIETIAQLTLKNDAGEIIATSAVPGKYVEFDDIDLPVKKGTTEQLYIYVDLSSSAKTATTFFVATRAMWTQGLTTALISRAYGYAMGNTFSIVEL